MNHNSCTLNLEFLGGKMNRPFDSMLFVVTYIAVLHVFKPVTFCAHQAMFFSSKILSMSLYQVDITSLLGAEYIPMMNDIARFVMIQLGIQVMLSLMDSASFSVFSSEFFLLISFTIVGVMLYHLVFKNLIEFK